MSDGSLGQLITGLKEMERNPFTQPQKINKNESSNEETSFQAFLKEEYQNELKTIKDMGFFDEDAILEVLKATKGNIDLSVEKLLSRFF